MKFEMSEEYNESEGSWWLVNVNEGPVDVIIKVEGNKKLAELVALQIQEHVEVHGV